MLEETNPRAKLGGNNPPEEFRLPSRRSLILGAGAAFITRSALALPSLCRGPFNQRKIGPVNPQCLAVPQGLVGYWPLGADTTDFNQGVTFDISGNNNTGALTGLTAASLAQGQVGTVLNFNGSTSYVKSSSNKWPQTSLTILAWINPVTVTGTYVIFATYNSDVTPYNQFYISNGQVIFTLFDAGGANSISRSSNTSVVAASKWQQVAATWNGGVANSSIKIFLNSAEIDINGSGTFSGPQSASVPATIGCQIVSSSINSPFGGPIEGVEVYNRALAPWEITTLYKAGLAGSRTPYP